MVLPAADRIVRTIEQRDRVVAMGDEVLGRRAGGCLVADRDRGCRGSAIDRVQGDDRNAGLRERAKVRPLAHGDHDDRVDPALDEGSDNLRLGVCIERGITDEEQAAPRDRGVLERPSELAKGRVRDVGNNIAPTAYVLDALSPSHPC